METGMIQDIKLEKCRLLNGKIPYGYCYGKTIEEVEEKENTN